VRARGSIVAAGGSAEIVSAPRIYGFDTGFVCYHRGWHDLRPEDRSYLWEHLVLNEIHAVLQTRDVHYWRSKHGNEVHFVLVERGSPPVAIECKWSADELDPSGLKAFRNRYPRGHNIVVAADVDEPLTQRPGGVPVRLLGLNALPAELARIRARSRRAGRR
jgi:predicted AAA+ superfamily ATPase